MANALGNYIPVFYAQTALIQLRKVLGLGSRVYLGYDRERRTFAKGQFINIRRPSVFTANAFTNGSNVTVQDVQTDTVQIDLSNHEEVTFRMYDSELAYTGEMAVSEHIDPAAYALADKIDQDLASLHTDIPHHDDGFNSSIAGTDIADIRKVQMDNEVPLRDQDNMFLMIDSTVEAALLKDSQFAQHQGAGIDGQSLQRTGFLTRKYGYEIWANQNAGTAQAANSANDDDSWTINNASGYTKDTKTINVDAAGTGGNVVPGTVLTITHSDSTTGKYAVTNTVAVSGNAYTGIGISPGLRKDVADGAVVTIDTDAASWTVGGLAFHRNAFALAFAPLGAPNQFGAEGLNTFTAVDPVTGMAVRASKWAEGKEKAIYCSLDVLYGYKTLDPDLACLGRRAIA